MRDAIGRRFAAQGVGCVLARTLQQHALAAIIVPGKDVQLRAILGADPNAHSRETIIREETIIGVERHTAVPVAVSVIATPRGNIDVIEEEVAFRAVRGKNEVGIRLAHHHRVASGSNIGRDSLREDIHAILLGLDTKLACQLGSRRPATNLDVRRATGIGGQRPRADAPGPLRQARLI